MRVPLNKERVMKVSYTQVFKGEDAEFFLRNIPDDLEYIHITQDKWGFIPPDGWQIRSIHRGATTVSIDIERTK